MKTTEEIYEDCKEFEINNLNYKLDWDKKWYSEEEIKTVLLSEILLEPIVKETKRQYVTRIIGKIINKLFGDEE